jgi:uncharacterized protein
MTTSKFSKYNLLIQDGGDRNYLYNTLYNSISKLDTDNLVQIQDSGGDTGNLPQHITDFLIKQKHIIPQIVDEYEIVNSRRKEGIENRENLVIIICPTMDCNFECPYCFESRIQGSRMSKAVEDSFLLWFENESKDKENISLLWFGGEPLLYPDQINRITKKCAALSPCKNFTSQVTTNGYLLKGKILDSMLDANITNFQVTLDGPREIHDKMRPLIGGRPSFNALVDNISNMLEKHVDIYVSLRCNLNHNNIEHVTEIFDGFHENIRGRLRVSLEPIFGDENFSATRNIEHALLAEKIVSIYSTAKEMGYDVSAADINLSKQKRTYCHAEQNNDYIFSYTGSYFKCATALASEDNRFGYIDSQGKLVNIDEKYSSWMQYGDSFSSECEECVYLPLCMGGCRNVKSTSKNRNVCTLIPDHVSTVLLRYLSLKGDINNIITSLF